MRSDKRLYLAADGETVVEDGDMRANTLLVGAGCEISDDEARRYGLMPKAAEPKQPARDVPDWSGVKEPEPEKEPEPDADEEPETGVVVEEEPEAKGKAILGPPATKAQSGPSRGRRGR